MSECARHGLSETQVRKLFEGINPHRVLSLEGKASYVAQQDARAHLTRIFGFGGWGMRLESLVCTDGVWETKGKNDSTLYKTSYLATVTIWVNCPECGQMLTSFTEANGTGDMRPQTTVGGAHQQGATTAISTALKRAVANLGDQFGLSLYDKGRLPAYVVRTWNPKQQEWSLNQTAAEPAVQGETDETGQDVLSPKGTEGVLALSEDGMHCYTELFEWAQESDAKDRMAGVVKIKAKYKAVLNERVIVEGDVLTLSLLADKVAAGRVTA